MLEGSRMTSVLEAHYQDYDYPFENLVFEGGGAKGQVYVGCLQVSPLCFQSSLYICCELKFYAWFPLNVSVIATNQSCLLARFAGFYRQPSFGLLRGLLYLEACKSRSASDI